MRHVRLLPFTLLVLVVACQPSPPAPAGPEEDLTPLSCVVGDWEGNGRDRPGVVAGDGHGGLVWILPGLEAGHTRSIAFGLADDQPLVGDWDGDGRDSVGVFRDGTFHLSNELDGGEADHVFGFGLAGDQPVAGDWDGDGRDSVGVFRDGAFHLSNELDGGEADHVFGFGLAGDRPVTGDWDTRVRDSVAILRDGRLIGRLSPSAGPADFEAPCWNLLEELP